MEEFASDLKQLLLRLVVLIAFDRHVAISDQFLRGYAELGSDKFDFMRNLIDRNSRLFQLLQRVFSRHLISEYETGKLNTPRIVAEPRRQPISFIEASKAGLEVLMRIRFPPLEVRHHTSEERRVGTECVRP